MFEQIMFYVLAFVAIVSGVMVVIGRNPISCAVSLIVTMGALAGMYVLLDAHFVATIQILVYAGAIMVLFVFVIMLLNLGTDDLARTKRFTQHRIAAIVLAALGASLLGTTFLAFRGQFPNVSGDFGGLERVSRLLFSGYVVPFEVVSLLLMAAMVGAVVIAKRDM